MPAIKKDGTMSVRIIKPGWGSSGFYPPEVLERDGPKVFATGTKIFVDHPTPTEEAERPERSVKDLAAELVTDARWEPNHPTGAGLYADAIVFEQYQPMVEDLAPYIGLSIRALGKAQPGKAEGKQGPIISEITIAKSVDLVTQPGAGGGILQLFESARRVAAQPIPQPKESTMGEKELIEANAQLTKKLDEQATALARLQEENLLRKAGEFAATRLAEATLPVITRNRLLKSLVANPPVKDGKLDEAAYATLISETVKAEAAYLAEVTGGGRITGMGGAETPETKPEELEKSMKESWMAMGYDDATAAKLAKGR